MAAEMDSGSDGAAAPAAVPATPEVVMPPLRLPMFDRLLDLWPDLIKQRLVAAWRVAVEVERAPLMQTRMSGHVELLEEHALLGVVELSTTRELAILAFDRLTVFGLIDAVLGGGGKQPSAAALTRPYTLIELSLMQPAVGHVLEALSKALAPAGAISFRFLDWVSDRAARAEPKQGDAALVLPLSLSLAGKAGAPPTGLSLALPLSALDPLRAKLEAAYPGDALGEDGRWRAHLAAELGRSRVPLTAVLHEMTAPLARMRGLEVGETLMLDIATDPVIEVRSGGARLATGRLGRANGHVAVRFETTVATQTGLSP